MSRCCGKGGMRSVPPKSEKLEGKAKVSLLHHAWLRKRLLIKSKEPHVAALLSLLVTYLVQNYSGSSLSVSAVASTGFTYASITVAACVSALGFSLSLPEARLRRWVRAGKGEEVNAYSNLVFVLVWACVLQLLVIVVCVLAMLFGGEGPLLPSRHLYIGCAALFVGLWIFLYALAELFVAVTTLFEIAIVVAYEEFHSKE